MFKLDRICEFSVFFANIYELKIKKVNLAFADQVIDQIEANVDVIVKPKVFKVTTRDQLSEMLSVTETALLIL